jgi:hypothetical protein
MTIYQTTKNILKKEKSHFNEFRGSIVGIVSKLAATIVLYPFNLIRSKQQQIQNEQKRVISENLKNHSITSNNNYKTFYSTCVSIFNSAGIRGYYQGVTPLVLRQIPSSAMFFYTFEYMLKILNKKI